MVHKRRVLNRGCGQADYFFSLPPIDVITAVFPFTLSPVYLNRPMRRDHPDFSGGDGRDRFGPFDKDRGGWFSKNSFPLYIEDRNDPIAVTLLGGNRLVVIGITLYWRWGSFFQPFSPDILSTRKETFESWRSLPSRSFRTGFH